MEFDTLNGANEVEEQSHLYNLERDLLGNENFGERRSASPDTPRSSFALDNKHSDDKSSEDKEDVQGNDARGSQQGARTPYNAFLALLKRPSSGPIVSSLKQFVETFPNTISRAEASSTIHNFLSFVEDNLLLTQSQVQSLDESVNSREGLEKFLTSKLHNKIFYCEPADAKVDAELTAKIKRLKWMTFEHLEIPPLLEIDILEDAAGELRKIDRCKSPRDKIVLALNCSRIVVSVLELSRRSSNQRLISADDILPVLIWVVIHSDPPRFQSNLEYISAFRHPSRFTAEEQYCVTQLSSAVKFILNLKDEKQLKISRDQFNRLMMPSKESDGRCKTNGPTVKEEVRKRLGSIRYTFEATTSADMLTVGEIPLLLSEYKELCETLKLLSRTLFVA